ncbi:MAG: hypothetical protein WC406_09685 [Methanoregula sp.]
MGNRAHLLYRIDLPNDDASRALVTRCLNVPDVRFSDGTATVYIADYNATRIWKLYGTMSRTGDNTADRSYRRFAILKSPLEPGVIG